MFAGSSSFTSSTPLRSAEVYDPATDTWTYISDMPIQVCGMGGATDGSKVYLAGGRRGSIRWQPYWVEYDPASDTYYYKLDGIKELLRGKETSPLVYVPAYGLYSINGYYIGALDEVMSLNIGPVGIQGDFDVDGDVDGSDLAVFAADFGRTDCGSPPLCEGDFDGDGDVDGSDLAVFAANFGRTDCPK